MTIVLVRVGQSERGTFGVLRHGQIPFAVTLEEPWRDNERLISCIPVGSYLCERVQSPKFGNTFEVKGVQDRSHILFHKGNTLDDTQGCILVAEEFSGTFDHPMIVSSERGFKEFLSLLDGRHNFTLVVTEAH